MATPFKHNLQPSDLAGIKAYGDLLKELLRYIEDVTNFNPQNRFIDSVLLLEKIKASAGEIERLYTEYEKSLLSNASSVVLP